MKSGWLVKISAIVCALCLAMGVMCQTVFARDDALSEEEYLAELPEATFVVLGETAEPAGTPEVTDNRTTVPLYVDGVEVGTCTIVDGRPYMGVAAFCSALGLPVQFTDYGSSLSLAMSGLTISAQTDQKWFTCNDRYVFLEDGPKTIDGALALPVETIVKCLGVTVSWDRVKWRVNIVDRTLSPLEPGEEFYAETDVYWLSHLIYAMAQDKSLAAQTAVGSVCMNRLNNERFGDLQNIYQVVMAKNAFNVVTNGMIYSEPDEEAVLAAKLALEGVDPTGGATYVTEETLDAGYEQLAAMDGLRFYTAA